MDSGAVGGVVIDKTLLANFPLWIVSLDLSKAFDGTHYGKAFLRHGVSQHLVWALRLVYWEQRGQIINKRGTSREFDIKAGVRQGRVLSPTQCSCVLEVALKKGRKQLQAGCLDFGDGGIPLLDLRFADDILLFATSSDEAARIVDALVTCLKEVGLAPSVSKTKILTTQALPGKSVPTQNGLEMEILDATKAHKWLGCLLSTLNAGDKEAGLDFRLQATLRAFYANQLILCDHCISVGLDHRCVHCIVAFMSRKPRQRWMTKRMRNWMPRLDSSDQPSEFQNFVRASLTSTQNHGNIALENILVDAAVATGHSQVRTLQFRASPFLRQLRSRRRHAPNQQCRKELSLQIRSLHRKEVRSWKTQNLAEHLEDVSKWKCLKTWLPNPVGRAIAQHPLEDDFADMLENLFVGPVVSLPKPVVLTEDVWTVQELRIAIGRLRLKKSPDQCGVSAELLQHVPEEFLMALLQTYNSVLEDGEVPDCWRTTCFHMLPKKLRAMHASDFRPIANLRLLYKVFAYLILGRIEHTLDTYQPEEQHGFRSKYRLEERAPAYSQFVP